MRTPLLLILLIFGVSLHAQDLEQIKLSSPLKFSGSFSANAGLSSISNGLEDRTSPYFYSLNTRFSLSWNELRMPFYLSLRDHSFNYGATTPRFRFNPRYKWAELQVGDVFMSFNQYTLSQRNMRGAAIKLTPGKLRFQALYGKMQELNAFRDTLLLGVTDLEVFSNKVLGLGIGFGTNSSHLDMYILKSWTDIDSSDFTNSILPRQDNVIVGSTGKIRLSRALRVQYNVGLSALTFDRDAIGNSRAVGENGLTGSVLEVNNSSGANYAGDVSINYSQGKFGLNGKITYIQPFYQPLTVAYINSDVLNYTVGSYVNLLSNKLYINGNIGIQQNNVSGVDAITTDRFIFNLMTNARLHKNLTANLAVNNFSQDLQARLVNIEDLYTYAVTNRLRTLTLTHTLPSDVRSFTNRLSAGTSSLTTNSDNEDAATGYDMVFVRWDGSMKMEPIGLAVNTGINMQRYDREGQLNSNYGVTLGASKDLLNEKLVLTLNNTFNYLDQGDFREGTSLITTLSANYKVAEKSNLLLTVFRVGRQSAVKSDFTETRSRLSYQQRF